MQGPECPECTNQAECGAGVGRYVQRRRLFVWRCRPALGCRRPPQRHRIAQAVVHLQHCMKRRLPKRNNKSIRCNACHPRRSKHALRAALFVRRQPCACPQFKRDFVTVKDAFVCADEPYHARMGDAGGLQTCGPERKSNGPQQAVAEWSILMPSTRPRCDWHSMCMEAPGFFFYSHYK